MWFSQVLQRVYTYIELVASSYSLNQLIFLFFLFSFAGWIIEAVYRSISNRRLVNPGFLKGPVVPIYGFSGILVLLTYIGTMDVFILYRLVIYFSAITILEYVTSNLLYRLFKRRYWDYSDNHFNIGGHVCLPFSLIWMVFSIIGEVTVYPVSRQLLGVIPESTILVLNGLAILVVQLDIVYSTGVLAKIRFVLFKNLHGLKSLARFREFSIIQLRHIPQKYQLPLKRIHRMNNRYFNKLKRKWK